MRDETERYAEYLGEGRWDDRPDHDEDRAPVTPLQAVLARCTHLAARLEDVPVCDMCGQPTHVLKSEA